MVNKQNQLGYMALIFIIILSLILAVVTISLSFVSYGFVEQGLIREHKYQSRYLAESCVQMALLRLNQSRSYVGGELVYLNKKDFCKILSVEDLGATKLIKVQGSYLDAYTNLEIVIDSQTYSLISWIEKVDSS